MNEKRAASITDSKVAATGAQAKPVQGRPGKTFLIGLAVAIVALVGITLITSKNPRHVPARVFMMTLMGFQHQAPGPWPEGNSFTLAPRTAWMFHGRQGPAGNFLREHAPNCLTGGRGRWAVINMHAENFSEIVRQLKLESVGILMVDKRACLVVDARIAREWFLQLSSASQSRSPVLQRAAAEHPDKFSLPATAPETH